MPWYTFCCAACAQPSRARRSPTAQPPVYCSRACHQRMRLMHLRTNRYGVRYHYTPAMDQAIIVACRKGLATLTALQSTPLFQGVPYHSLRRRAMVLGVARTLPNAPWTDAESAIVEAYAARGSAPDVISRALRRRGYHRTAGAVMQRMQELRLSRHDNFLSVRQAAIGLGVDDHILHRWIQRGLLAVHHTTPQGAVHYVSYPALRAFIVAHPSLVANGAPDIPWLISVLVDPTTSPALRDPEPGDEDGSWLNGTPVIEMPDEEEDDAS